MSLMAREGLYVFSNVCVCLCACQRDFDAVATELTIRQENSEVARRKLVDASRELKKTLSTVCITL